MSEVLGFIVLAIGIVLVIVLHSFLATLAEFRDAKEIEIKKDIEELSVLIPKMQIFRRIIAENLFIIMEKRIMMLQSQSAHERYEKMLKENPEILLSVPLQYTASFLGITPQHLSRLRKELQK
jgi:long-subunit acyl-CoA synthetase (AMP-forming)